MQVNFDYQQQRRDEEKYLGHSEHFPALQKHSVGELYPWSVVAVGRKKFIPKNLVTGKRGPVFTYSNDVPDTDPRSFIMVHRACEQWIRNHVGLCIAQQPQAADVL